MPGELLAREFPIDLYHLLATGAFAAGSTLSASAAPASARGPESEAGVRHAAPCDMVGGASSVAAGYDTVTHLKNRPTSASRDMVAPPCHGPHTRPFRPSRQRSDEAQSAKPAERARADPLGELILEFEVSVVRSFVWPSQARQPIVAASL